MEDNEGRRVGKFALVSLSRLANNESKSLEYDEERGLGRAGGAEGLMGGSGR